MAHVTALLLDLSNIIGGFLLGALLLQDIPRVGPWIARVAVFVSRGWFVIGVLALVAGGYYLIMHLTSGPHVFHFELVGLGVGVALLRDRLFPQQATRNPAGYGAAGAAGAVPAGGNDPASAASAGPPSPYDGIRTTPPATVPIGTGHRPPSGGELLLAVFGLIAVVVGIQGLFTPDD